MPIASMLKNYAPDCEQEIQDLRLMLQYTRLFDNLLVRDNEMVHFTASSWIVNPARTHVLMAYHNIYRSWSWTGGHADGDPDLLRVALREAREETAIEFIRPVFESPYSLEILSVPPHVRKGKFVPAHLHLNLTFLLEADARQDLHAKPDENSAVGWFPLEKAIEASAEPAMQVIYRKLNGKLPV